MGRDGDGQSREGEVMGQIRTKEWYDDVYDNSANYQGGEADKMWGMLWDFVAHQVPDDNPHIIDIGCGDGAMWRHIQKDFSVTGIDFSKVALSRAATVGNPTLIHDDLETIESLPDGDCYVFCEVMEHIENDIRLLSLVPTDKWIIITVPSFDSDGHVRHFRSTADVADRYAKLFGVFTTRVIPKSRFSCWFLMTGSKI